MSGVRLEISGKDEALRELDAILSRVEHPRGMFENIGLSLVTSTQRRFEEGHGPDGSAWPPSLRALAEGGKTLIKTARLMQSITFVASDSGVEVGTNVLYAAIHQLGGTIQKAARKQTIYFRSDKRTGELGTKFARKRSSNFAQDVNVPAHTIKIPARPFLGLDDDDGREIIRIGEDWLAGEARP
jgi:phage virion morphogenesis protein